MLLDRWTKGEVPLLVSLSAFCFYARRSEHEENIYLVAHSYLFVVDVVVGMGYPRLVHVRRYFLFFGWYGISCPHTTWISSHVGTIGSYQFGITGSLSTGVIQTYPRLDDSHYQLRGDSQERVAGLIGSLNRSG